MEALASPFLQLWQGVYSILIGNWLWSMYRYGPQITSWGFWAGLNDQELCARLAPMSQASDWFIPSTASASAACQALIHRSYQSFAVLAHTIMYACVLYFCLRMLFQSVAKQSMAKRVAQELLANGVILGRQ